MEIDKRKLSFNLATKSCEVLAVNVTAEKLWSLVEAFEPILESGLTQRAADLRQHCGHHAKYLYRLGNGKLICGYCGASR